MRREAVIFSLSVLLVNVQHIQGGTSPSNGPAGIWTEEGCIVPQDETDGGKGRKLWGVATIWLYDEPVDPCKSPCGCIPSGLSPPLIQFIGEIEVTNGTLPLLPTSGNQLNEFGGYMPPPPGSPCWLNNQGTPPPPTLCQPGQACQNGYITPACGQDIPQPFIPPMPVPEPFIPMPPPVVPEPFVPMPHPIAPEPFVPAPPPVPVLPPLVTGPILSPIFDNVQIDFGLPELPHPIPGVNPIAAPDIEPGRPWIPTNPDITTGTGTTTITEDEWDKTKLNMTYDKDSGKNTSVTNSFGQITPQGNLCPCADATPAPPVMTFGNSTVVSNEWDKENMNLDLEKDSGKKTTWATTGAGVQVPPGPHPPFGPPFVGPQFPLGPPPPGHQFPLGPPPSGPQFPLGPPPSGPQFPLGPPGPGPFPGHVVPPYLGPSPSFDVPKPGQLLPLPPPRIPSILKPILEHVAIDFGDSERGPVMPPVNPLGPPVQPPLLPTVLPPSFPVACGKPGLPPCGNPTPNVPCGIPQPHEPVRFPFPQPLVPVPPTPLLPPPNPITPVIPPLIKPHPPNPVQPINFPDNPDIPPFRIPEYPNLPTCGIPGGPPCSTNPYPLLPPFPPQFQCGGPGLPACLTPLHPHPGIITPTPLVPVNPPIPVGPISDLKCGVPGLPPCGTTVLPPPIPVAPISGIKCGVPGLPPCGNTVLPPPIPVAPISGIKCGVPGLPPCGNIVLPPPIPVAPISGIKCGVSGLPPCGTTVLPPPIPVGPISELKCGEPGLPPCPLKPRPGVISPSLPVFYSPDPPQGKQCGQPGFPPCLNPRPAVVAPLLPVTPIVPAPVPAKCGKPGLPPCTSAIALPPCDNGSGGLVDPELVVSRLNRNILVNKFGGGIPVRAASAGSSPIPRRSARSTKDDGVEGPQVIAEIDGSGDHLANDITTKGITVEEAVPVQPLQANNKSLVSEHTLPLLADKTPPTGEGVLIKEEIVLAPTKPLDDKAVLQAESKLPQINEIATAVEGIPKSPQVIGLVQPKEEHVETPNLEVVSKEVPVPVPLNLKDTTNLPLGEHPAIPSANPIVPHQMTPVATKPEDSLGIVAETLSDLVVPPVKPPGTKPVIPSPPVSGVVTQMVAAPLETSSLAHPYPPPTHPILSLDHPNYFNIIRLKGTVSPYGAWGSPMCQKCSYPYQLPAFPQPPIFPVGVPLPY